jgi:peptidoglycan/LPS O-acetylase OafA/YrhL
VNPDRSFAIDVLRGLAVLLVLVTHFFCTDIAVPIADLADSPHWNRLMILGVEGVTIFFAISGYVITRSLWDPARRGIHAFYARRFSRIWPLFAMLVAVLGAISLTVQHDHLYQVALMPAGDAPFGDGWFGASIAFFMCNWYRIFSGADYGLAFVVLWSLAVEEQFYLAYPWLVRGLPRPVDLIAVLACIAGGGFCIKLALLCNGASIVAVEANSAFGFEMIAIGAMAAWAVPDARAVFAAPHVGITGWILLATGLVLQAIGPYQLVTRAIAPEMLAGGTALVMAHAQVAGDHLPQILSPVAALGRVSFGAYLLHTPILWLLAPLSQRVGWPVAFATFIGMVWLVADFSYRRFEEPMRRAIYAQIYSDSTEVAQL